MELEPLGRSVTRCAPARSPAVVANVNRDPKRRSEPFGADDSSSRAPRIRTSRWPAPPSRPMRSSQAAPPGRKEQEREPGAAPLATVSAPEVLRCHVGELVDRTARHEPTARIRCLNKGLAGEASYRCARPRGIHLASIGLRDSRRRQPGQRGRQSAGTRTSGAPGRVVEGCQDREATALTKFKSGVAQGLGFGAGNDLAGRLDGGVRDLVRRRHGANKAIADEKSVNRLGASLEPTSRRGTGTRPRSNVGSRPPKAWLQRPRQLRDSPPSWPGRRTTVGKGSPGAIQATAMDLADSGHRPQTASEALIKVEAAACSLDRSKSRWASCSRDRASADRKGAGRGAGRRRRPGRGLRQHHTAGGSGGGPIAADEAMEHLGKSTIRWSSRRPRT